MTELKHLQITIIFNSVPIAAFSQGAVVINNESNPFEQEFTVLYSYIVKLMNFYATTQ